VAVQETEPETAEEAAEETPQEALEETLEEIIESAPPTQEELEWARIDAALDIPGEVAAPPPALLPEQEAANMRFDLAGVIIDGSSLYSARELLPIYRHYLGKEVLGADLYRISYANTARYAADGYADTSAVVPTQLIRSGVVTIRIQESFLGGVIVVE